MRQIPVTKARPKLSELVSKVARGKRYVIAQKGKRGSEKAVLVGLDEFQGLKRQVDFRQLLQDTKIQLRNALGVKESLDDDAAMQAADDLVQQVQREAK